MSPSPDSPPANIILITIDCWRGDYFSGLNDSKVQTPHVDKFAAEGAVFSRAFTCGGWTKIAMTALFSSTYSSMYGFAQGKMSAERPLLAEILQQNGYETAGFTTNLVCGSNAGFDRGFDTFQDMKPDLTPQGSDRLRKIRGMGRLTSHKSVHAALSLAGIRLMPVYPSTTADDLVDHALKWLSAPRQRPYFLWLHFMDIHWPYRSSRRDLTPEEISESWRDRAIFVERVRKQRGRYGPGEERESRWKLLYKEEMQTLDQALGRFFTALQKRLDWPDTAVIVTGDHGEEFLEHGTWGHSWNQLYDEGIHVPLIMRLPGAAEHKRVEQSVSHIDLAPTLLDLAQVDQPLKMIGRSLLPLVDGRELDHQHLVYTEMHGHANSHRYRLAIQDGRYKYIYDGDAKRCQLFDLIADPGENLDCYAANPAQARRFDELRLKHISRGVLDVFKDKRLLTGDDIPYDIGEDPSVAERLQALGYMD